MTKNWAEQLGGAQKLNAMCILYCIQLICTLFTQHASGISDSEGNSHAGSTYLQTQTSKCDAKGS